MFAVETPQKATMKTVSAKGAGSSIGTAPSISLNAQYSDSITKDGETDYYKFTLPASGRINLKATLYMSEIYITIFDETGEEVWRESKSWNSTTQQISCDETIDLTSGIYYICFDEYWSGIFGKYKFSLNFASANESFNEGNGGTDNLMTLANTIGHARTYYGQIAANDDMDYYKFTLENSGRIRLQSTLYMEGNDISIFDPAGKEIWSESKDWNSTTQQISCDEIIDLTSGSYYICFEKDFWGSTGNYNFRLNFTSANESFQEGNGGNNNTIPVADSISLGKTYRGQVAKNDEKDFYRFSVSSIGKIQIRLSSVADLYLSLYDASGERVDSWYVNTDSSKGRVDWDEIIELEKRGIYYFCVEDNETGSYNFSISSFTPSIQVKTSFKKTYGASDFYLNAKSNDEDADFLYSSSNRKVASVSSYGGVTIGKPGTATITIRIKGTSVTKKVKITVVPKRASLVKVKKGKRSLKAIWLRDRTATGYQIVAATNKKFTKNKKTATVSKNRTTSKTIRKLKRKTYYVKVRAYKKVGKIKLYGTYSKTKKVKVR